MKRYTLNKPSPSPLPVTGAALRSVQAADTAAEIAWNHLASRLDALDAILDRPNADATTIADGMEALAAVEKASEAIASLAPRWRTKYPYSVLPSDRWGVHTAYRYRDAIQSYAEQYAERLSCAGVPMGPEIHTVQYWRDAAARGC